MARPTIVIPMAYKNKCGTWELKIYRDFISNKIVFEFPKTIHSFTLEDDAIMEVIKELR
jgi:hypothetical protein